MSPISVVKIKGSIKSNGVKTLNDKRGSKNLFLACR